MSPRRTPPDYLRVVPHRPDRERRLLIAACISCCVVAVAAWGLGRHLADTEQAAAIAELATLRAREQALVVERDALARQLSDERLGRELELASKILVRGTLGEQAGRIIELEDELRFYRKLMAGDGETGSIEISDFELTRRLDGSGVRFRLLLVRPADRRDEVTGHVELRIRGEQAGQMATLSGSSIGQPSGSMPFRFRYFQNLAGEIELPEGFVPEGVEIIARAEGRDGFELQRQFSWELQGV